MQRPAVEMVLAGLLAVMLGVPLIDDRLPPALLLQSVPDVPYLGILGLILLMLVWYWVGARYVGIIGLVGIVAIVLPGPDVLERQSGTTLRVATWNTEYWDQTEGSTALGQVLAGLNADVLMLQEHLYWDAARGKTVEIDRAELLRECCGYAYIWQNGELVTASRLQGDIGVADGAHILVVTIEGVRFLNVHVPVHITRLHSPARAPFWHFLSEAAEERAALFQTLAELGDSAPRNVIGGDFNATFLMPGMRKLALQYNLTAWPPTFPNGTIRLWRLDHLGDTANSLADCASPEVAHAISDHLPIICDLELQAPS
jgi:endonuclease/exonuclease/phosphatase family metal-dependent hydrolase